MSNQPFSQPRGLSEFTHSQATSSAPHDHAVQFYEDESFLVDSVAKYYRDGLNKGESAVFIATLDHRNAVEKQLEEAGLDLAALSKAGSYFALDAGETLNRFMADGCPNPDLFRRTIGPILEAAANGGRKVRAFGEMVALLWKDGNRSGAIRLEELWNDLGQKHWFELLCAYPMKGFEGECFSEGFGHICSRHSHVIPTESYGQATKTEGERLREIALLQQKAISLEKELAKRKAAEDELCDFLENATEPIHKVSEDGIVLWANQAELDLLGYSADEVVGNPIAKFHADQATIEDIFARLKRGERLQNYEARLLHKDGTERIVAINSSVYWQGDNFRYTRCFSRDITATKLQTEMLERLVEERTAELTEKVGELEAFSYSVSHDLRSPLRAMQGYAKSLLLDYGESLDGTATDRLKRIQRAAERLDLLVRDVLCYSRVSQSKFELKPVSLAKVMDDLLKTHPELEAKASRITVGALHEVKGNEAFLGQCIANLIENGLKFSPPERLSKVSISSEVVGDTVRVNVRDDGIGILEEHRSRLFQIFGRVYSTKTYEGTGIGLAIVKKAVSRMGGEIGFDSVYGEGSRFWFTVPGP